jgi:hypothetical protein
VNRSDRIRARQLSESDRLKSPSPTETYNTDYPIFCFRHILNGYKVEDCSEGQRAALISKIAKMSQQSWQDLMTTSHWSGAGFEHVEVSSFNVSMPSIITEDVSKLLVMRFSGTSHRLIGHRRGSTFHVTHVDVELSAYSH